MKTRLGDLERAVMDVLWEQTEPMTVREVGRALADRDLAHTTVMTVLDRLAKKESYVGTATDVRGGIARQPAERPTSRS